MILVDHQIKYLAEHHRLIDPFDEELLNPASLDIRLGNTLLVASEHGWVKEDISTFTFDDPFWFYPNEFVLAESYEIFNFPSDVCGEFKLKSSRGREGYDHGAAGFIDPDWTNSRLTLELKNIHPYKRLPLYPKMRIGQIVFMMLSEIPNINYSQVGHYNNDLRVQPSKVYNHPY